MNISKSKFELLLAEKELSLTQLAELSGISRQNISTIKQRGTCIRLQKDRQSYRRLQHKSALPEMNP